MLKYKKAFLGITLKVGIIVILIYIAWLVLDFYVFGKPMFIAIAEEILNKTIMEPVNLTNISRRFLP